MLLLSLVIGLKIGDLLLRNLPLRLVDVRCQRDPTLWSLLIVVHLTHINALIQGTSVRRTDISNRLRWLQCCVLTCNCADLREGPSLSYYVSLLVSLRCSCSLFSERVILLELLEFLSFPLDPFFSFSQFSILQRRLVRTSYFHHEDVFCGMERMVPYSDICQLLTLGSSDIEGGWLLALPSLGVNCPPGLPWARGLTGPLICSEGINIP